MNKEEFIKIVQKVKSRYPGSVFPDPVEGCSFDNYAAYGCRLACDAILEMLKKH